MLDLWGETTTDVGAPPQGAIFYPGAGRDPLSDEWIAARGYLLAVVGGAGRAAARDFIAALVPAYYASRGGAGGLRQAVEVAEADTAAAGPLAYVVAALADGNLFLARMGGGRAYRVRGATVESLARATAPVGPQPAYSLAVPLLPGDRVALCSAAVAAAVGDGRGLAYVAEQRSPREAASRLVALAHEHGAGGDVSVVVAFVRPAARFNPAQMRVLLALGVAALAALGWLVWELWRLGQAA
ncbi:MAG TPA: hypothetical protein PK829_02300 [Promineifilum sp.]|nr:hypothetical protein [Promineifilum sp.]